MEQLKNSRNFQLSKKGDTLFKIIFPQAQHRIQRKNTRKEERTKVLKVAEKGKEKNGSRDEDRKCIWQKIKERKKYTVKSQETKNKAYNSFDCLGEIGRELAHCPTVN